jgi:hypothetical protein
VHFLARVHQEAEGSLTLICRSANGSSMQMHDHARGNFAEFGVARQAAQAPQLRLQLQ